MRSLVQRVAEASVTVGGDTVGAIGPGLLALVGVTHDDTEQIAKRLAAKIWNLRVLDDEAGVMNRSLADVSADGSAASVLVVSQFTLYGRTGKGRRPTWEDAAAAPDAEPLVDRVAARLRESGAQVTTGVFGADMRVTSTNDGPFTILVEV